MNVELKTPSAAALREYNENAARPYLIADSCLLDGGAVELEIGGVTIAGIFHDYDAYELALGVLDMEYPERPENRVTGPLDGFDETHMLFETPEQRAEIYTEEELEYEAWSALTALHNLRSRQEAAGEPNVAVEGENTPESFCGAELPTQRFTRGSIPADPFDNSPTEPEFKSVPHDFMTRKPAGGVLPQRTPSGGWTHVSLGNVTYLDHAGIMSHAEVADHFNQYVSGASA